jgi:hypothetical protein
MLSSGYLAAKEPTLLRGGAAKEEAPPRQPVDLSTEPPPSAPPPTTSEGEESWLNAPPHQRCGFTIGLGLGSLLGATSGYPNDATKVDRDEFYENTGFSYGSNLNLYIGIALADWFTVGVGPTLGQLQNSDTKTGFFTFGFHLDVYPAFGLGGHWENIGLMVDAGLGGNVTTDKEDDTLELIQSPVSSRLATGVVFEGVKLWKFKMGPFAAFDAMWSPTSFRPAGWLGWRTAFYAGP